MARYIPPPREDFIDPRTKKISVSWFKYLLKEAGNADDVQLQGAMDAFYGVAAAAQAEQRADEATLLASIPLPTQDVSLDIEAARLSGSYVDTGEIEKRIDDLHKQFIAVKIPAISDHSDLTGLADDDHTQYLLANGTRALTADWDAGSFEIRAQTFESDVTTGTAPLVIASTTKVTNLNADLLDDQTGTYYLDSANFTGTNWTDLTDGGTTTLHTHTSGVASSITLANEATDTSCFLVFVTAATGDLGPKSNTGLTFNSNTGALGAVTLVSTVVTGTSPLTVASTTKVANLNADLLDDQSGAYYLDAANFTGANWTDLTDTGATTLHKHDHGGMDGLTDDDHGHYWNYARGAARVSLRV